jgi:hypothetical protein
MIASLVICNIKKKKKKTSPGPRASKRKKKKKKTVSTWRTDLEVKVELRFTW